MGNHADITRFTWLSFGLWVILTTISYIPGTDRDGIVRAGLFAPIGLTDVGLITAEP
jgi:hypothetical protein